MNRLESMLGPAGLIICAFFALIAVMLVARSRLSGRRSRPSSGGSSFDLEMGDEGEATQGPATGEYEDFGQLLERFVLPLHASHPDWERLDGAYGVPGRLLAWFNWDGTRYGVRGDTRFEPLLMASNWLREHPGEDALVVRPSKGGAGRLQLRPEIGWKDAEAVTIETG